MECMTMRTRNRHASVGKTCVVLLLVAACMPVVFVSHTGVGHIFSPATAEAFTPPSTGLYVALDCEPTLPGIQDNCTGGTGNRDVSVVLGNVDQPGINVLAFNFDLITNQQNRFD